MNYFIYDKNRNILRLLMCSWHSPQHDLANLRVLGSRAQRLPPRMESYLRDWDGDPTLVRGMVLCDTEHGSEVQHPKTQTHNLKNRIHILGFYLNTTCILFKLFQNFKRNSNK